jgi:DNA-binding IclR family transcriptional regulator
MKKALQNKARTETVREKTKSKGVSESSVKSSEARTIVKPVANAIAILRYMAGKQEASTATQIARDLKINTSTCFNILRTMTREGVVSFEPVGKTYKPGMELLKLASSIATEDNRLMASRPLLHRYAERHGVTICIWRRTSLTRNSLVAIEHPSGTLRIHLQIGQHLPVLLGSAGRVMATRLNLTKAQIRKEFKEVRWFRAPDFEAFWSDAQAAAERGWAIDDGNYSPGVLTLAAPVTNQRGEVGYVITALTFRDQHSNHDVEGLGTDLAKLADELSTVLH